MAAVAVQVREGVLLALLEQHGSLAYEQAAAQLGEEPERVRSALESLRERGLVGVFGVGELRGYMTTAVAYWRVTPEGRCYLDQASSVGEPRFELGTSRPAP